MNPVREELISAEVQVDANVPVNSTQVYRVMDTAAYSKSCMEVESLCVSLLDAIYPILICGEVNMLVDQTAPTDNLMVLMTLLRQVGVSLAGERIQYSCFASNYLHRIFIQEQETFPGIMASFNQFGFNTMGAVETELMVGRDKIKELKQRIFL